MQISFEQNFRRSTAALALATLGAVALLNSPASGALLAHDSFLTGDPAQPAAGEYSVGRIPGQSPNVQGFSSDPWFERNGDDVMNVVADGLSYSNGSQSLASAGGAFSSTDANGQRVGRQLSTRYDSDTVYLGVLLQISSTSGFKSFGLSDGGLQSNSPDQRTFTIGPKTGNWVVYGPTDPGTGRQLGSASADTTNLFVAKMDFGTGPDSDTLTVYRNPSDLGSEPTTADFTKSGLNLAFDHVFLEDFVDSSITADEIRIGDTFADVTAVPEPTSLALVAAGGMLMLSRRRRVSERL